MEQIKKLSNHKKMAKNNWTRKEHIVAFNLYCKTPFTKINSSNAGVQELAPIIGRSVGAVAMKLANFARLDPTLKARGIKGLERGSKGEEEVWEEFHGNWEELAYESERILAEFKNEDVENSADLDKENLPSEGKERETIVKTRVNQSFFRKTVLASYDNRCCITGIQIPELLIGSHIKPWSSDQENRMNPRNGLCLNALHDKAFDRGLITIDEDFKIVISEKLEEVDKNFFKVYQGGKIKLPQKFYPEKEFLQYHNDVIFKG